LGPLRRIGDSLVFPVITAVTVGGTPTAYVVNWRRVQASPEATQRFTALIGADASLLVGNVSGDVWTDLSVRVDGPPVDVRGRPGGAAKRSGRSAGGPRTRSGRKRHITGPSSRTSATASSSPTARAATWTSTRGPAR